MKKYLKNIALAAVAALLLVQIPQFFLPYYWGNEGMVTKIRHLEQHPEINTIFLGASTVYRHINPQIFDSLVPGARSFNLGYQGFFNPELFSFAENFLKNLPPHVQTVVLETQPIQIIDEKNIGTVRVQYGLDFENYRLALEHARHNSQFDTKTKFSFYKNFSLAYFRRLVKMDFGRQYFDYVFGGKLADDPHSLGRRGDGFYSLDENEQGLQNDPAALANLTERKRELEEKPQILEDRRRQAQPEYFKSLTARDGSVPLRKMGKLLKIARSKNVKLFFLVPPRLKEKQLAEIFSAMKGLPDDCKIDLSDPTRYPKFYDLNLAYDIGHLNLEGTKLYTEALAEQFLNLTNPPKNQ